MPGDNHRDLPCILDIDMFHLLVGILSFVFEILSVILCSFILDLSNVEADKRNYHLLFFNYF